MRRRDLSDGTHADFRSTRSIHALSPATTQALVSQFAHREEHDAGSVSSESPDSLYSNTSPTFADQAFEFDMDSQALEYEERDEDEYESIMGSMDGRDLDEQGGQGWSRWPEAGLGGDMGWTPSPVTGGRSRSIISISPRGSISASTKASSLSGRRPSTPGTKLRYDEDDRRGSNPSLLGFDLAQRRESARSLGSTRRRSSAVSISSSVMDPIEDARLRNIASMGDLGRRFSEVVEVTVVSDSEGDASSYQGSGSYTHHPSLARAALQSPWSPETLTDDDEDSEIMTAPYVPTPDMPSRRPLLLSNYPLPSAVRDDLPYETPNDSPSEASVASPSPMPPQRPRVISQTLLATPPPPARPLHILRGRQRPSFPRAATDYHFPPRSEGVPAGAGPPRPTLSRAISTPFFSTPQKTQPIAIALAQRATEGFAIARSVPLGASPLKNTLRRQSIASEVSEPRRGSLQIDPLDSRRSSLQPRRLSMDSRPSSFAERRMSIVNGTCLPPRRISNDTRRSSTKSLAGSRRSSSGSVAPRRDSGAETRRSSADRRSSQASRKSSVVSIGEYGYLAPQIVVDTPTPAIPSIPAMTTIVTPPSAPPARLRANAPSSIALPQPFSHAPSPTPTTVFTPSGASRFNPLETFLGMSSVGPSALTPTPGSADLFTPRGGDITGMFDVTPKSSSTGVMDRPRPIMSPEFRDAYQLSPRRRQERLSPKGVSKAVDAGSGSSDTCVDHGLTSGSSDTHVELEQESELSPKVAGPQFGIVRKAVPQLTAEEQQHLASASSSPVMVESDSMKRDRVTRGHQRNYYRRGAVELFTPSDATLPRPPMTRRAVSVQGHVMRTDVIRPVMPRQATLQEIERTELPRPSPTSPGNRYPRAATVTFAAEPKEVKPLPRPPIARVASGSTLSRFFHGRSRSTSSTQAVVSPSETKPARPSLRPKSMEGYSSSSGSDKTLVEVRDLLRKVGGSPRSPRSPRDVSAHVARAVG